MTPISPLTESQSATMLSRHKEIVDEAIESRLPLTDVEPRQVHEAMRYATLGHGKRLRPLIALGVCEIAGRPAELILDTACAIEYVHTASLILDDLPSMDNAVSRRDRPCTHAAYGEATAILSALGLIALGFDLVAKNAVDCGRPESAASAVRHLAHAVGTRGIICGQHDDLDHAERLVSMEQLERVYHQKAGALFLAAALTPASLLGLQKHETSCLERFARCMGMALQITDDLVDAQDALSDIGRTTFSTHLGVQGAREKVHELIDEGVKALRGFGDAARTLRLLAELLLTRAM